MNRKKNNGCLKYWPYALLVLFALFLLGSVIRSQAFVGGLDSYFHMNGFYEDAMQIKTGHFSYFLSRFGFDQSGRIVNALYGPVFNYLMGGLLLICGTWVRFGITLSFLVLLTAGLNMYALSRTAHVRRTVSVLMAFLYMISHSVLTAGVGNGEFTGVGAAILPFAMILGVQMAREHRVRPVLLGTVMAIFLQVHLLTSFITAGALVPFFLVGLYFSQHRTVLIKKALEAVGLTILLSGNLIGGVVDVFTSNHLIPTFPKFNLQTPVQNSAISIQHHELTVFGWSYTVVMVLVIVSMLFLWHRISSVEWAMLIDSLGFLLLASAYFPWNHLVRFVPKLASVVQFPQRFIVIPQVMTLVLLGRLADRGLKRFPSHRSAQGCIFGLLVVFFILNLIPAAKYANWLAVVWHRPYVVRYDSGGFGFYREKNPDRIRATYRSPDLKRGIDVVTKVTPDYLPTPRKFDLKDYYSLPIYKNAERQLSENHLRVRKTISGSKLLLTWTARSTRVVPLPAVRYGHTQVDLNGHRLKSTHITDVGAIKVRERPGVNHLMISYHPGWFFIVMSTIMIISWLVLIMSRVGKRFLR